MQKIHFTEFIDSLKKLPTYAFEVGVVEGKSKNDRNVKKKKNKYKDDGITNAEILFINENGSPIRHIPARPVLKYTIDWAFNNKMAEQTIDKMLKSLLETGDIKQFDKIAKGLTLKLQNEARKMIYENTGIFKGNSKYTIKMKGFDHPLFRTGQLARSIRSEYYEINKKQS